MCRSRKGGTGSADEIQVYVRCDCVTSPLTPLQIERGSYETGQVKDYDLLSMNMHFHFQIFKFSNFQILKIF